MSTPVEAVPPVLAGLTRLVAIGCRSGRGARSRRRGRSGAKARTTPAGRRGWPAPPTPAITSVPVSPASTTPTSPGSAGADRAAARRSRPEVRLTAAGGLVQPLARRRGTAKSKIQRPAAVMRPPIQRQSCDLQCVAALIRRDPADADSLGDEASPVAVPPGRDSDRTWSCANDVLADRAQRLVRPSGPNAASRARSRSARSCRANPCRPRAGERAGSA